MRVLQFTMLLGLMLGAGFGNAQTFKVRVLNALNGQPYLGVAVTYHCEGQGWDPSKRVLTGSNGDADINYSCEPDTRIKIDLWTSSPNSPWDGKIEECGDLEPQSIKQILEIGVISNPTADGGIWCPAKISKTLRPVPGQVIIFVKKPTWWQRNIAP